MKTKLLYQIFLLLTITSITVSCVNDGEFTDPKTELKTYDLTVNRTVEDLNNDITSQNVTSLNPLLITTEDIIEAYVTSSDESGNFFSSISFQTKPTLLLPNPVGFSVAVDLKAFNNGFTPGRKVFIKLKGLYAAIIDGSLKIGSLFDKSVGRISKFDWEKYLFLSNEIIDESFLVRTLTLAQAATPGNINTLIEINNVQFTDSSLTRTLFDIDSGGFATNHNIVDVNGGTNRFLRISSFSTLSAENVPSGRGKIRGVMSKFGLLDFQFIIRYLSDLKLNTPRNYTFSGNFTENFEGFSAPIENYDIKTSYISFPNYINFTTFGTKNWYIRNNKLLEMGAFFGATEKSQCYFLLPVDMTAAKTFKFSCAISFYTNGTGLKIYRTNDYVPGNKISDATLYDITSNFTIPTTTTSMTPVGTYSIPEDFKGNGFFVFEYTGTNIATAPPVTTTVQIDNIVVNSN